MKRTQARRTALALAAFALLHVSAEQGAGQPAGPPPPPVWHAWCMESSEIGGFSVKYFWSKGRSLRVESVIRGQPVLTLVNREWYYAIDVIGNTGIAVQRSPRARAEDARGERPFGDEARIVLERGEKVRSEKLGTATADVYRLNDETARRDVWVAQGGERLPLRVEIFDRALKTPSRRDYMGWTQALDLPDSFFEPDPRVKLERMSYDEYLKSSTNAPAGPVPVLYGSLLHGPSEEPAAVRTDPSPR
jgi:hypothetical protein